MNSAPITSPAIAPGSQVSWAASSGNTYQPQESANGTTWVNLGAPLSGNTVTNRFDPTPAPFYQVQEFTSSSVDGVVNPGFETADGGYTIGAQGWINTSGVPGNVTGGSSRDTSNPYAGAAALKLTYLVNSAGGGPAISAQSDIFSGVSPGSVTLTFQAKRAVSGNENNQVQVQWFDAGNVFLGASGFQSFNGTLTPSYTLQTKNYTAPANTAKAMIQFLQAGSAVVSDTATLFIDSVSLTGPGTPVTNIVSAAVQPGVGITWSSQAGRTYTVQSSPSVAPLTWSQFGANVLGTDTNTVSDAANSSNKFYRVLEVY